MANPRHSWLFDEEAYTQKILEVYDKVRGDPSFEGSSYTVIREEVDRLLAVQGPSYGHVFVVLEDGSTFLCEACATTDRVDLATADTWEVGSTGWLGPVVCAHCGLSIPIYVEEDHE
jgi:hypothetical protein